MFVFLYEVKIVHTKLNSNENIHFCYCEGFSVAITKKVVKGSWELQDINSKNDS